MSGTLPLPQQVTGKICLEESAWLRYEKSKIPYRDWQD